MSWELGDELNFKMVGECQPPYFLVRCMHCKVAILTCRECLQKGIQPICTCRLLDDDEIGD